MTDAEFLRAFFKGWPSHEPFRHREHLRLAFLVIDRHGPELAAEIVGDGLKRMAAAQNQAVLYNETMTRFWVRLVAHVSEVKGPFESIDKAIEAVPLLLVKELPYRHWSRAVMFSDEARAHWVEPDLQAMPA
jgi:hypothetical protein